LADIIALVGSETLLGREVRDVFGESALGEQLRLLASDDDDATRLADIGGEPAILNKLDPEEVEDAAVVILAGTPESSRIALESNPTGVVIDLTGAAEEDPQARRSSVPSFMSSNPPANAARAASTNCSNRP